MDFLKLCVYVKFFNYQVAVSFIVNNPIDKVIAKARKYFEIVNYFPEECVDRVWLFVKPSYNDGLTMIKLSDLRER